MIKDCFLIDNFTNKDPYLYSVDYPTLNGATLINCPFECDSVETEIVGSCNGLLCLADGETMENYLYNPATRKHRVLPDSPVEFPLYAVFCDRIIYGFGYDHVNNDYKLVRIIQLYAKNSDFHVSEVKIYSLKTNSWKRVRNFPYEYYVSYGMGWGADVNGCLHWVVTRKPVSDGSKLIVAFDFGYEDYKLVPQPEYSVGNFLINVGVLEGCLRVLAIYEKVRTDVWIMKEYGVKESWTKLFSLPQWETIGYFDSIKPIAYSKNGSEVLIEQDFKKLVWLDVQKRKAKNIKIRGIPVSFDAVLLVESLVPLDSHKKKKKKKPKKKRNEQSGQLGTQLATLPICLLYNVLSRLPAKTLLQSRCVCKAWNNLIHDPHFAKMHLEVSGRTKDNLNLIIREEKLHLVDLNLLNKAVQVNHALTRPEGWTDVLGSCNGLLCLSNHDKDIALWNPLTGSCHKLPITTLQSHKGTDVFQSFICGFGFDPVSDDYKVVQILQRYINCGNFTGSEVHVYSLKTNYWSRIQCFPYVLCYSCSGVLANGALHWVAHRRHDLDSTSYIIMAFDLGSEKCREVKQPNYDDIYFHMSLGLLSGSLCILCHYPKHGVDIWVMKGSEQSRCKLISIIQPKPIKFFEYIKPLVYSQNGCEVLLELDYEKLIWYNLKKKSIRHVNIHHLPNSLETEVFSGSLLDPENVAANPEMDQRALNEDENLISKNKRNDPMPRQKKQPGQLSNLLATFREKLLCQIFSRLAVKTLLQVQCVSKTWYNLINGTEFIKMHLEVSKKCNSGLSLILNSDKFYSIDFQLLDKAIEIKHPVLCNEGLVDTVGSSNGLICLYKGNDDFALWNPLTGKHWRIPPLKFHIARASKAFHCFIHGFGYDPATDDYKVVCIMQQQSRVKGGIFHTEVQVYSLRTNSWKQVQHFPYFVCYPCSGVLASGSLHWVARHSTDLYSNSNLLIAFDLGVEKCWVLTQPNYVDTDFQMSLGLLGGSLCLLCHYPKESFDLWVMTDYVTESWVKLISIKQSNVVKHFEYMKPLANSEDGSEVLFEQDNEKLLWYNLTKKTIKYVELHGLPKTFETVMCSSSLVSIGNGTRNYQVINEQPPKGFHHRREKKERDDLDGFLTKGFKLKL